jgi:hypothetical protein
MSLSVPSFVSATTGLIERTFASQLRHACDLAEAVADVECRGHTVGKEVAAVRQDRGHAGSHAVAFDYGRLAHANTRDVGDCVERAGRKYAGFHAELTRAHALRAQRAGDERHGEKCRAEDVDERCHVRI